MRNITSIASLVLREEPFGGLAYDPVLRTVFALNALGYSVLKSIQSKEAVESQKDKVIETRAAALKIVAFLSSYGVAPTASEIDGFSGI